MRGGKRGKGSSNMASTNHSAVLLVSSSLANKKALPLIVISELFYEQIFYQTITSHLILPLNWHRPRWPFFLVSIDCAAVPTTRS